MRANSIRLLAGTVIAFIQRKPAMYALPPQRVPPDDTATGVPRLAARTTPKPDQKKNNPKRQKSYRCDHQECMFPNRWGKMSDVIEKVGEG